MIDTNALETDIDLKTATQAYYGTSFSPEKRGAQIVEEYMESMVALADYITAQADNERKRDAAQGIFDQLRAKYRSLTLAWLASKSRCVSTMIAGPANFNVRRAEKANVSEHNRLSELADYEKSLERIAQKMLDATTPPEEKAADELAEMRERLAKAEKAQEMMKQANALLRKGDRVGFMALVGEDEANGLTLPEEGFRGYQLTNNLANIKRMRERVAAMEDKEAKREEGNKDEVFYGVIFRHNFEVDRLQVIFDGKPDEATRAILKGKGFKWAPSQNAWQRQLTGNALYAARAVVAHLKANA